MRGIAGAIGALLAVLFVLSQVIFWSGTSLGVVREHCGDLEGSTTTSLAVDSGWTYILWPPAMFANIDPVGSCVRNSPLREGLAEVGVWELPSPEEQVREHIRTQLEEGDER